MGAGFSMVGQGLAGCCLAWKLREKGAAVWVCDDRREGAASRVAAGLVNPVTGKNFEPSWRIGGFLPEAVDFYEGVGREADRRFWFPMPVVRLVSDADWAKVAKKLERPEVGHWVRSVEEHAGGWRAAVVLEGGGRVDVAGFCGFVSGRFEGAEVPEKSVRVRCEGAAGLMDGSLGPHRCAKGEILTVRISGADEGRILIGAGGWLVPLGGGLFKAGSTYEWEKLDGQPTEAGLQKIRSMLSRLGIGELEVVAHEAGIRPIVRRSMPLIGRSPCGDVVFNGLGSKGSLYAPGVAGRLADWLVEGKAIEPDLDVAVFAG